MKRFLLLMLAAAMVSSCVSCGGESTGSNDATTAGGETNVPVADHLDDLVTDAYKGKTFSILDACHYPGQVYNAPADERTGDLVNDGLYKRNSLVEEKFGITFQYTETTTADEGITLLKNAILSGDDEYQLVISRLMGGALSSAATEGLLADLCSVDQLELSEPWWSHLMYENLRLNDKMYFTAGDISPEIYNTPYAVFFNLTLLDEYQIDTDFHQLVRDGKWTIDALYNATMQFEDDVNGDGKMHCNDDFFGITYQSNTLAATGWTAGAGVNMSTIEGGTIKLGLTDERATDLVEKLRTLTCKIQYDDHNDIYNKAF
ncbi:MAG: hypothetical protein E7632_13435, partial [Ruminococcaceae bacterium]|nr:hypothetical protein [Oscillospiraceae bacterium]